MTNPWIEGHIEGEMAFTGEGYTRRQARANVLSEYSDDIEPVPCDCGKTAYYKATIGACKCPDCGALYDTQGGKY